MKFLEIDYQGKKLRVWVEKSESQLWIHARGKTFVWECENVTVSHSSSPQVLQASHIQRARRRKLKASSGLLSAPMPGKIIKIDVSEGESVEVGHRVVVMEAMKMEYSLCAEISGRVHKISCREGQQVALDQELVLIK